MARNTDAASKVSQLTSAELFRLEVQVFTKRRKRKTVFHTHNEKMGMLADVSCASGYICGWPDVGLT